MLANEATAARIVVSVNLDLGYVLCPCGLLIGTNVFTGCDVARYEAKLSGYQKIAEFYTKNGLSRA